MMSRIQTYVIGTFLLALCATPVHAGAAGDDANVSAARTQARAASLIVRNLTECPVALYADGAYIGTCESFTTIRFGVTRLGKVTLMGRAMCDVWGPVEKVLQAARPVLWQINPWERVPPTMITTEVEKPRASTPPAQDAFKQQAATVTN